MASPRQLDFETNVDPPPLPPKPRSSVDHSGDDRRRISVDQLHQVPQGSRQYFPSPNAHPPPHTPPNYPAHPPPHTPPSYPAHPAHPNLHTSPSYPGTAGVGTFVPQPPISDVQRRKDEIHLLRMSVNDKEVQIQKMTRDLDHCHDELRRLNQLLAEKKEYVLKYQEKISDHQSENVALKQENSAMKQEILALKQRQAVTNQVAAPSMSHDSALQLQIQQLRQQVSELQQRNHELQQLQQHRDQPAAPPHISPIRSSHANSPVLVEEVQSLQKQVEIYKADHVAKQQEIFTLKSRVEVLNLQVMTYNEDFHTERSDRERAQAQIHSLKEENESLHQAITLLAQEHGIRLDTYGLAPRN